MKLVFRSTKQSREERRIVVSITGYYALPVAHAAEALFADASAAGMGACNDSEIVRFLRAQP
jgi:hypothetical protein